LLDSFVRTEALEPGTTSVVDAQLDQAVYFNLRSRRPPLYCRPTQVWALHVQHVLPLNKGRVRLFRS
jgi:hypothetical protein